jgi:hypothetical protein
MMAQILAFSKWFLRGLLILAVLICGYAAITEATLGEWADASYKGFAVLATCFGMMSYFTREIRPSSNRTTAIRLALYWSITLVAASLLVYLCRAHTRRSDASSGGAKWPVFHRDLSQQRRLVQNTEMPTLF